MKVLAKPIGRRLSVVALAMAVTSGAFAEPESALPLDVLPVVAMPVVLVSRGPNWALRLPKSEAVDFHGVVNYDQAGSGPGAMMYPAPGPLGLIAAIVTHGVIMASVKSAEKTRLQTDADQVLAPYQSWLKDFQHKELMQKGLEKTLVGDRKHLLEAGAEDPSDWVIDSTPMFAMTQDRCALILDNVLTIRKPGALGAEPYQATVRVVSQALTVEDVQAAWSANQGASLKEESVRLFAQSLDLGLAEAQKSDLSARAHKTVRYLEGKQEKMERGEVIDDRCGRVVIKTLRGGLMSVPAKPSGATISDLTPCS